MDNTYDVVLKKAREIVNKHDPMGLIAIGAPWDEYDPEIKDILRLYIEAKDEDEFTDIVWGVFVRLFDEGIVGPKERFRKLAKDLWDLRVRKDDTVDRDNKRLMRINGIVEAPTTVSEDDFWEKFICFMEENNWTFGGGIREITDDEE